jgi:hypothetical protein
MDLKVMRILILGLTLVLGVIGCSQGESNEDTSSVTGKVTWADDSLSLPKPKPQDGLQAFGKKLTSFFANSGLSASSSAGQKKKIFGKHFVKSVAEIDGIPREQGEGILKDLVSPKSQACGGASCSVVFALKDKEIPGFLDELLDEAGTSKELAQESKKSLRDKIIGSLIPGQAVSKPSKPRDYVASIYRQKPKVEPPEPQAPKEVFSYDELSMMAGDKFIHVVYDYTSTADYHYIRKVESTSRENLRKEGMSSWDINRWTVPSNVIFEGMKKIPPIRGKAYRGMQDLTAEDIASWVRAWQEKKPIGLGFGDQPATTSASWSVEAAMKFLRGHIFFGGGSKYAALLEITNHRGVAIERVSKVPEENEVLLPRNLKVTIESIVPMENAKRTFIIKMRGVTSAYVRLGEMRQVA